MGALSGGGASGKGTLIKKHAQRGDIVRTGAVVVRTALNQIITVILQDYLRGSLNKRLRQTKKAKY